MTTPPTVAGMNRGEAPGQTTCYVDCRERKPNPYSSYEATYTMLVQACLNGARVLDTHPALPRTPQEFVREARRAITAGAQALHLHPRDDHGHETFDAASVGAILAAVRAAFPAVPVGGTTGAWIAGAGARRSTVIATWTALPDYVSVNLSENNAVELCEQLLAMGVGIEAGISSAADARLLVDADLADRCVRLLLEPEAQNVEEALACTFAIEAILDAAQTVPPRLLHGIDATAWPVLEYALGRGYDIRIGLEDTLLMPDGSEAEHNGALVAAAVAME